MYRAAGSGLPACAGVLLHLSAVKVLAFQRHAATPRVADFAHATPVPAPAIVPVAASLLLQTLSGRRLVPPNEVPLADAAAALPLHQPAHRKSPRLHPEPLPRASRGWGHR